MSGGVAGRAGCVKTGTLASTAAAASSRSADDEVRVTAVIIPTSAHGYGELRWVSSTSAHGYGERRWASSTSVMATAATVGKAGIRCRAWKSAHFRTGSGRESA